MLDREHVDSRVFERTAAMSASAILEIKESQKLLSLFSSDRPVKSRAAHGLYDPACR